ncbi:MAG: hypothetical protein ACOYXU_09995 [Nitrospirota bacterium]
MLAVTVGDPGSNSQEAPSDPVHERTMSRLGIVAVVAIVMLAHAGPLRAQPAYDCTAAENRDRPTTIEIVLAQKWKPDADAVKQSLIADLPAVKVRVKFYPFLDPPTNIGIGSCVSAEVARRAIQEAIHTSGKIDRLIRQDILPHHWVKIGSTDTAEMAWIPVGPDDVARLSDPALTTDQFQELYRTLAAPKERPLPFGMGTPRPNPPAPPP